jgi:hypothetical protein
MNPIDFMPLFAKFVTFSPDARIFFIVSSSFVLDFCCFFSVMPISSYETPNLEIIRPTVWPQFSQINHAGRCNIALD